MICKICGNSKINILYKNYPCHKVGTKADILNCSNCDTSFAFCVDTDKSLYDLIYKNEDTSDGYYGPYLERFKIVKSGINPLKNLLSLARAYYPIYNYLKNKKGLKILEIGCGYGYLVYALGKNGHDAFGIDVSNNAINFALKNYGKNYLKVSDLGDLLAKKEFISKFDLIISTEVIEHVLDPKKFIDVCIKLLEKNGKVILTTPNKSYFHPESIWPTDLPPVHLFFFSPKSFDFLAEQDKLKIEFVNFSKSISFREKNNELIDYFLSRKKEKLPEPIIDNKGEIIIVKNKSFIKKFLRYLFVESVGFRLLSNILYKCFFRKIKHNSTLGIIIWQ